MDRAANLAGRTSELTDSTEAFRLATGSSINVGRLRTALGAGPLASLAGKPVAVRFRDDRLAAPALWLLDGMVPRLLESPVRLRCLSQFQEREAVLLRAGRK